MSHSLSTRRVSAVSYNTKQCIGMNLHIQTSPTLKLMSRKPKVLFTRHHRWFSRQSYICYEITLLSPRNYDVWGMSIAIPYWRLVNTQVWIVLLIGWGQIPRGTTNQKYCPDPLSERHQNGISALVPQTWFRGKTSGGVAICCPFSLASIIFIPGYCYSWHHSKVWGINLTLNKPKTDWIEYTR